jgi:hypothetical protein
MRSQQLLIHGCLSRLAPLASILLEWAVGYAAARSPFLGESRGHTRYQ